MKSVNLFRLSIYLITVSLGFINAMCEKAPDPAPAVVTPTTPTKVDPTLPEGIVVAVTQTETGLWPETYSKKIDPVFNDAGQVTGITFTNENDKGGYTKSRSDLKYNTDGYLIERKTVTDYSDKLIPQWITGEKFEYQNGRLSKVLFTSNIDENYKQVPEFTISRFYQYDAGGNLTLYRKVDQNGVDMNREQATYDGSGKITSYSYYNVKSQDQNADYTFTNGKVSKNVVSYKGKVTYIAEYEYDVDERNSKYKVTYPSTGVSWFWTLKYDDKKAPKDLTWFYLSDAGGGGQYDYLLFKGHPKYVLWSMGQNAHNLISNIDSNPLGRQHTLNYQYNSQGYPTEVTYKVYNGTQKQWTEGKRTYTYFKK